MMKKRTESDWIHLLATTVQGSSFAVILHSVTPPPLGIDAIFLVKDSLAASEFGRPVSVIFENGFRCSGAVGGRHRGDGLPWLHFDSAMRVLDVKSVGPASWLLSVRSIFNGSFDVKASFAPNYPPTGPERNVLPVADSDIPDRVLPEPCAQIGA